MPQEFSRHNHQEEAIDHAQLSDIDHILEKHGIPNSNNSNAADSSVQEKFPVQASSSPWSGQISAKRSQRKTKRGLKDPVSEQQQSAKPDFISSLPSELLIHVFSYLHPKALSSVSLVCQSFHSVLLDDSAWRSAFMVRFDVTDISVVPRIAEQWRDEYIIRIKTLMGWKNWSKNGSLNQIFDTRLGAPPSDIFAHFSAGRLISASVANGHVSLSEMATAKVSKEIVFPETSLTSQTTSLQVSRAGILYGFSNGRVVLGLLEKGIAFLGRKHASLRSIRWIESANFHNDSVSSVDLIIKDNSFQTEFGRTVAISGSADGEVKFWDIEASCLSTHQLCKETIMKIEYSWRNQRLIIVSTTGVVYTSVNKSGRDISNCTFIKLWPQNEQTVLSNVKVYVDWVAGNVLLAAQREERSLLWRIGFESEEECCTAFADCHLGPVTTIKMQEVLPGTLSSNGILISGDTLGCICAWDARSNQSQMKPLWQVQTNNHVTSIALDSIAVYVGTSRGHLTVYDILDGDLIRILAKPSRSNRSHIGMHGNDSIQKIILPLDNYSFEGVAIHGNSVRVWKYGGYDGHSSRQKRTGHRTPVHAFTSIGVLGPSSKAELQHMIHEEKEESHRISKEKQRAREEMQRKIDAINGTDGGLGDILSESELLQYVEMISLDEEIKRQDDTRARESFLKEAGIEDEEPYLSAGYSSGFEEDSGWFLPQFDYPERGSWSRRSSNSPQLPESPLFHGTRIHNFSTSWEKVSTMPRRESSLGVSYQSAQSSSFERDLEYAIQLSLVSLFL